MRSLPARQGDPGRMRANDFAAALRRGRRLPGVRSRCFWVARSTGRCRLGLIVSRAVGAAVVRNRVRRVIRETVRGLMPPPSPGDLVVLALPGAGERRGAPLREELTRLLRSVQKRASCR